MRRPLAVKNSIIMTDGNEPITPDPSYGNVGGIGLTKREYFAGQILATMSSDIRNTFNKDECEARAACAVTMADTLIRVLNNTPPKP